MDTVFEGEIRFRQYLSTQGDPLSTLPVWAQQPEWLTHCYRNMVLARTMDNKAVALQRTGQLGTYASLLGIEGIDVPLGLLMHPEDVLVPYYRNHACQMLRGMPMEDILLYWGGDERGNAAEQQGDDFPNSVPIATQSMHACGVATALKIRNEKRVAVTLCGDGATSKGDFLESLNCAGAWNIPLIFVVNNNQWAISVPRSLQCAAEYLSEKATGAGIPGITVDGNDIVAMFDAILSALDHARKGKGATLIEAISYRLSDHTTADDATRYRSDEELHEAWEFEPISRLKTFLIQQGYWSEKEDQQWLEHCQKVIEQAVDNYLNTPGQAPESAFDFLYFDFVDVMIATKY